MSGLSGVPHVVAIQETGVRAGHAYVVTEYCGAGSLQDHLRTVGRLTPIEVRRIGAKLAGALAAAHARGIYHRKVKPANILIDRDGEPALTDFGLVSLALSQGDFGPPLPARAQPFSAPEAYLPELMSTAADIYSLGATLYALLAGGPPRLPDGSAADGETVSGLPRVPWHLMTVIRRAMAPDPRERYPDAAELRATLTPES